MLADPLYHLLTARNGGEAMAGFMDLAKMLGLPQPNRKHAAGLLQRHRNRDKVADALWATLRKHVSLRQQGGIADVTAYVHAVLERTAEPMQPVVRDPAAATVDLARSLIAEKDAEERRSAVDCLVVQWGYKRERARELVAAVQGVDGLDIVVQVLTRGG